MNNRSDQTKKPFTVIIPARYASSRFPGKPLALLGTKPMLLWVYELALKSQATSVHIATDDERIAQVARAAGASVVMTSPDLASGTERVWAAAKQLRLSSATVIVNVQGDEPRLPPAHINRVAQLLHAHPKADMTSLSVPITDLNQLNDRNCVKVVCDVAGRALFFSRAAIPMATAAKLGQGVWHRHLGLYAYRLKFLDTYVRWPRSAYEQMEDLEQLRALYHGAYVLLAPTQQAPAGIDTPADLQRLADQEARVNKTASCPRSAKTGKK